MRNNIEGKFPPEKKLAVLSSYRIFSSLSKTGIQEISDYSIILNYKKGEYVFSPGDEPMGMYILIFGALSIIKTDENETETEIARLVAGDSLGEIDMISGTPRTVSARVQEDSLLLEFPAGDITFWEFTETKPKTGSILLYAFIQDIAERTRRANELLKENSPHIRELRRQIYQDKLTGLLNKTWLEENLGRLMDKEKKLCLLMFKPDNFKEVNDLAGHEAGDNLLIYLAHNLPKTLPKGALLVRYAGNEFAVILQNTGKTEALETAEKIREFYRTLDVSAFLSKKGFHLTASIGIAISPNHASDSNTLIAKTHPLPLTGRALGGNKILFPDENPIKKTTEGKS